MDESQFKKLRTGDIIMNRGSHLPVIVTASYGNRVTAVQTFDVTNSQEWDLIYKSNYKKEVKNG